MYKKEFDALLAKQIPQLVFLYGEGSFFIDFYIQELKKRLATHTISQFYFDEFNLAGVVDILGAGSLFGDASAVILKLDSKLSKKDCESLLTVLKDNEKNHLIIGFYRADSKASSQYMHDAKNLALMLKTTNSADVRFFDPTPAESIMLLKNKASSLSLGFSQEALEFLLQMQNYNLALALNELDKYLMMEQPVDINSICNLSYGLGSIKFDDFLHVFFEHSDFLNVYKKMREEGLESMEFLREMQRYFYTLFLFSAYAKIHGKCDAKEILGYVPPQFVIDTYTRRALRFKQKDFQDIFEIFTKWHNGIMDGRKEMDIQALIQLKAIL